MAIDGIGKTYIIPPVNKDQESEMNKKRQEKKNENKGRRERDAKKRQRDGKIDIRV